MTTTTRMQTLSCLLMDKLPLNEEIPTHLVVELLELHYAKRRGPPLRLSTLSTYAYETLCYLRARGLAEHSTQGYWKLVCCSECGAGLDEDGDCTDSCQSVFDL